MRKSLTVLVAACAMTLAACGSTPSTSADPDAGETGGLLVATTVSPITSIASAVGGDRVTIKGIVPEGTNSHTYEPEPRVAELLSTADLILINGLKLEDPTKGLAETNMSDGARLVEIGTEVLPESDYIYDFSFPKEEGKPNPHLWTDPTYAVQYAAVIRDQLIDLDPANADYYSANYSEFAAKADELANAIRMDQETIPAGGRKLVTYHDAYAYFAKNFGWTVVGALQPKNFSDPSPAELADLIDQVKAENVRTIFGSEVFPSKVLEEIGSATGARYEDSLRDDDLPGQPGESDHSWLGLMKYDYATMIRGLGGDPATIEALDVTLTVPDNAEYPQ